MTITITYKISSFKNNNAVDLPTGCPTTQLLPNQYSYFKNVSTKVTLIGWYNAVDAKIEVWHKSNSIAWNRILYVSPHASCDTDFCVVMSKSFGGNVMAFAWAESDGKIYHRTINPSSGNTLETQSWSKTCTELVDCASYEVLYKSTATNLVVLDMLGNVSTSITINAADGVGGIVYIRTGSGSVALFFVLTKEVTTTTLWWIENTRYSSTTKTAIQTWNETEWGDTNGLSITALYQGNSDTDNNLYFVNVSGTTLTMHTFKDAFVDEDSYDGEIKRDLISTSLYRYAISNFFNGTRFYITRIVYQDVTDGKIFTMRWVRNVNKSIVLKGESLPDGCDDLVYAVEIGN